MPLFRSAKSWSVVLDCSLLVIVQIQLWEPMMGHDIQRPLTHTDAPTVEQSYPWYKGYTRRGISSVFHRIQGILFPRKQSFFWRESRPVCVKVVLKLTESRILRHLNPSSSSISTHLALVEITVSSLQILMDTSWGPFNNILTNQKILGCPLF